MTARGWVAAGWVAAFVGTIVLANWLTSNYGLVPVGFGLVATAGTYAAGFAFVARDGVDDALGLRAVLAAIAVGVVVSYLVGAGRIAVASGVAFGLSELADLAVYRPLRGRGYMRAAAASNLVGTLVDTIAFLTIAGFTITTTVFAGQIVGKLWVTLAVLALVGGGRLAVLRHQLR